MLRVRCWLGVLSAIAVLISACISTPESYPVPPQHRPFRPQVLTSTEFVGVGASDMSQFIVRDIQAADPGVWRWTGAEPELQFILQSTSDRTLIYEFVVHETTFKDTGPVTITFLVNQRVLAREHYDKPGEKKLEQPVPEDWLQIGKPVRVAARVENCWRAPDGAILGILFKRAGFVP
jgi:hypothetical protein